MNFEYTDYVDKEEHVYINVYSMASLRKRLKMKTSRVKGSNSSNPKPNEQEEEAAKKAKEDSARTLAARAKKLLAKEKQREEEEEAAREEKRKKEEAIQGKIVELENSISHEALNIGLEGKDLDDYTEEQSKKNEGDLGGEYQEQSPA